jgi:DNA helicase HerA-like ATPase
MAMDGMQSDMDFEEGQSVSDSGVSNDATASNVVGVVYGDVGTTDLKCGVTAPLEKSEYVQIPHDKCGLVLGQVDDIERKTNLSLEGAKLISEGEAIDIEERVTAVLSILGYRDDRGLLQVPGTPFKAGSPVLRAEDDLIRKVIGIKENEKSGAYIGLLGADRGTDEA